MSVSTTTVEQQIPPANLDRLIEREYRVRLDFTETLLGSRPTTNIAAGWLEKLERDDLARTLKTNGVVAGLEAETPVIIRPDGPAALALAEARIAESTAGEGRHDDRLGVTGFSVDDQGRLHLWDFQLKGFIKGAVAALDIKVPGKKADAISGNRSVQLLVWVFGVDSDERQDRRLYLKRDAQFITGPDGLLERPLRAQTMQGERVSIAVSEQLHPPLACEFRLAFVRGCRFTDDQVADLFTYAQLQGLGQWRSSGLGRCIASITRLKG